MIVPIHMDDIEKKEFFEAVRIVKESTSEVMENLDSSSVFYYLKKLYIYIKYHNFK